MPTRDEIKQELLRLLGESPFRQARPEELAYVSAYQLFNKLPAEIQDELAARGSSGRGGGWYDSGAKAISKMLMEMSGQVESAVMESTGVKFFFEGQEYIEPGDRYAFGLYRLNTPRRVS